MSQPMIVSSEQEDSDGRDPTYFSYYAQFVHQQNMLQDSVRTSLYQTAILANGESFFSEKTVMDLGAGSGILSYFAVKAGARLVYAVEASGMADRIQKLMEMTTTKNTWLNGKIIVVKSKIEDITQVNGIEMVDTLVSEPIGVLLLHERMIESYIVARDRFLKPGGVMIPSMGTIYVAPFSDSSLWSQTNQKVRFWEQQDFYGVDLSPLGRGSVWVYLDAKEEVFGQPIVGGFDPRSLISPASAYPVDFRTVTQEELKNLSIPFTWVAQYTGLIHGIACWFDINLGGYILSTAPHSEKTHWHQVRLMLKEPLAVNAFETVCGVMHMKANSLRSYDITAELVVTKEPLNQMDDVGTDKSLQMDGFTRRSGSWALHEQTYYFDSYEPGSSYPENMGLYESDSKMQ